MVYDLRVVVEEVKGFCDLPMKPGDYFEVRGGRIIIPDGGHMCLWALSALMPMFPAKQRNSDDANDWLPSTSRLCCPDPDGMVIYRIDRIASEESGGGAKGSRDRAPAPVAPSATTGPVAAPPPRLLVKEKNCSGCRACELACSAAHGGVFRPAVSRIRVRKLEEEGIDQPRPCRQCGQARCVEACPEGALSRHPVTKAVVLDREFCTKCGRCAEACAFGAIPFDPAEGYPLFCDLCVGDPACVKRCATGALHFGRAGERQEPAPAESYLTPPPLPQPLDPAAVAPAAGKEGDGR